MVILGFHSDQKVHRSLISAHYAGDGLVMCPGEHWNYNDDTVDNYQAGTYYIQVQTYSYSGDFTLTVNLVDIGTSALVFLLEKNKKNLN